MRRKLSTPEWRFPQRMTRKQWSALPYRERHAVLAQAQCTLLEYWRDCANARCRRARRCLVPRPCYWEREQAMIRSACSKAPKAYGCFDFSTHTRSALRHCERQRSNPGDLRGNLDCFVAVAPRNDEIWGKGALPE